MALSGECFVGMAKRNGMTLVGITLGCETEEARFTDVAALFDYGFDNYKSFKVLKENETTGTVKVKYGHHTFVETKVPSGAYITMPKSGDESLATTEVKLKDHVEAPIKKGTKVGIVTIYENGKKSGTADVVIAETVKKGGPWAALYISDMAFAIAAAIIILIIAFIIIIKTKKRNARKRRELERKRQREARARQIAAERMDKERRGWPY
jgi:D-alanyl-D-alanine carboxypeptidase